MSAVISDCGKYRYRLDRRTPVPIGDERQMLFIMLNPSTADAELDDPTIRKCRGFCERAYHGGFTVVNLFAYRATDPAELKKASDPIGPENMRHIMKAASEADTIICAWGTKGSFGRQNEKVINALKENDLFALELTKDGHPKHPLYISYDKQPIRMKPHD